jgi:hypothetical protein
MFTQTKIAHLVLLLILSNLCLPVYGQEKLKTTFPTTNYKLHHWSGKMSNDLIYAHDQFQKYLSDDKRAAFQASVKHLLTKDNSIRIEVAAQAGKAKEVESRLKELGASQISIYKHLLNADLPYEQLEQLAKLENILFARPVHRPYKSSGNALSQGDAAIFTDNIRTNSGFTGSGIKVGAMSDSYDDLGGASTGVLNKELPGVGNGDYSTPVQVLADYTLGANTDEGRALLEIVHDVAPAATLAFHTAFGGISTFANGITNLYNVGCNIIVEDVRYYASPFFMDGLVAQAAETAISNGTIIFSSAGNQGSNSYEANYNTDGSGITIGSLTYSSTHEFSSGDIYQQISIPSGQTITLVFQWDDPFASVTGSTGADADIDIYLINTSSSTAVASSTDNNLSGDPVEIIQYTNGSGSTETLSVLIGLYSGSAPSKAKYVIFNNTVTIDEYATNSATCYGQANAENVIAVGAVYYVNTPEYGVDPPVLESFSSSGGVPIMFDNNGSPITPVYRAKPEFCGPDGGDTSFFGFDTGDAGSYPNFFGTSASAPHLAGLAALLLEAVPGATPTDIKSVMASSSVDIGSAGFDSASGFGLVDGETALSSLQSMLPLEWGLVTAQTVDENIHLYWETLSEHETAFFEIEHATDGKSFTPVDEVIAAGFSTDKLEYLLIDEKVKPGTHYYRIKQYDLDGQFSYSKIVSAQVEAKIADWQVYPNPFSGELTLVTTQDIEATFTIELYNTSGQLILKMEEGLNGQNQIDLSLPFVKEGLYYLRIVERDAVSLLPIVKTGS